MFRLVTSSFVLWAFAVSCVTSSWAASGQVPPGPDAAGSARSAVAPRPQLGASLDTSVGTTVQSGPTVAAGDPIYGTDGFYMVPVETEGLRPVREFDWGTLRTLVYQGRRLAELKIYVNYPGPAASPICTVTGQNVQIDQAGFRLNTVGTQTEPATEPVGFTWSAPPEFTSGYAVASAKFSVDLQTLYDYGALTVVVPAKATVNGWCQIPGSDKFYYESHPSSTMTVRIVFYKDFAVELAPYDSDQIIQVQVKQLALTPCLDAATCHGVPRNGVEVQTKPAVGEKVSLSSKSGTFTFSPEKGVTENYQDAMGLALFNYSAQSSLFGSQPSIKDDVEATIGTETGWGRQVWLNFAEVESVLNDVTAQPPLGGGYVAIKRGDKLAPGTIIQLRNTLGQDGKIKAPVLSLHFYSGRKTEVELTRLYTYDPDQGPLYLKLGESGVTQQAAADFVTDGTNLAREIAADPRQYARVVVYDAVITGLVNAVGGGFGFLARSTAGKLTKWGLENFDDWYKPGSPDQPGMTPSRDTAILPSGGAQDGGYVVGTFMSDGSLVLSNSGAPVRLSNVPAASSSVLFTNSELSVSGSTGTLSAATPMLIRDLSFTVPILITPVDGTTVTSLWPCISLEYPNDAVVTQPLVDLSSLALRVNGYLVSADMFPGAYATGFKGTFLKSTWCAPADRPFRVGANAITAGISTFGSQRAKTSVTITAQGSAPRPPANLVAHPGVSRILLSWTRNGEPDIANYRVYRGVTLLGQSTEPRFLVSAANSLAGDYSVTAFSTLGFESAKSAKAPAALAVSGTFTLPGKPSALQITAQDSKVDLRVVSVGAGSLAWRIERSSADAGPFVVLSELISETYVDESVTNGSAYWYKATPIGYDGVAGAFLTVGPVIPLNAAPSQPKGVSLEMSEAGALIEWNPSSEKDLAGYRLYRREYLTANWVQQNGALLQVASFSNTVESAKLYAWKVTAVDSGGLESPGSEVVTGGRFGTVDRPPVWPTMTATPSALRFAGTNTSGTLSPMTGAQPVTVGFSAPTSTSWTATTSQPWVQISGGSGTGSGTFTVSIVNPGNVLATIPLVPVGSSGMASAVIMVSASGASNSPQMVVVDLTLRSATANVAPFGLVDTPLQHTAGVVGTIGVTGWVVDDVGVTGVKVYRNCLAFEPSANCIVVNGSPVVFVGDATLVAGARPDVEAIFPTYPQANRAAWGYLLLTNLLPHVPNEQMFGGQGPVTLCALATDAEGKQTWLGREQGDTTPTTITMANDTIGVPFGAIDTPGQGETVSGQLVNFGWALTPDADTTDGPDDILVPLDGSTMKVFVDGVLQGTVSYNQCRGTILGPMSGTSYCDDDVSSIFGNPTPQGTFTPRVENETTHRNLDAGRGAIGAFVLDTTTLANGGHTIVWGVTDSASRAEGIGSRYFTVLNGGADGLAGGDSPAAGVQGSVPVTDERPVSAKRDVRTTVMARTGFDLAAPWSTLVADDLGVRHVQLNQLGRLELQLGPVDAGYLAANGERRELPMGSRLDSATGQFTWMPGVGYFGTYRLVFVRADESISVDVTIRPVAVAAQGEAEIRMSVDLPRGGETVAGSVRIAGWALDPQASIASGVDAVHVWAQRTDLPGAPPEFLGAATLGGQRPDVATAYGPQFGTAAFDLTTTSLVPGQYDLTVYVWNRRTARWEDARTVSVTVR